MKIGELETHPAADAFPLMRGQAFRNLVDSIKRNGIRRRGVLFQGRILDGRNRALAALELGAKMAWESYEGDEPIREIVILNIDRRHLNESQRAMAANRLAALKPGTNRKANSGQLAGVPSQAEAAALLNVSERAIRRAREVLETGTPEVIAAVDCGDMTVSAAAELVKLPVERQRELAADPDAGEIRRAVKDTAPPAEPPAEQLDLATDPRLIMQRAVMKACSELGATVKLDRHGLRVAFHGRIFVLQVREELAA